MPLRRHIDVDVHMETVVEQMAEQLRAADSAQVKVEQVTQQVDGVRPVLRQLRGHHLHAGYESPLCLQH